MLAVNNISFGHKGGPQFNGISFTLPAGTLNTVIGPNGSGKSTLLHALTGLLNIQNGEITFAGTNLCGLKRRSLAKLIAYVPQQINPAPINVFDAVMLGRTPHIHIRPTASDKQAVYHALELLQLSAWAKRPLNELSGGERQKVYIALALAQETPVIILDEPAGSLDLRYQLELYELLRELCKTQNKLVIAAEHDLNLAANYSDTVMVMHGGKIAAAGTAQAVITANLLHNVYGITAIVQQVEHELSGINKESSNNKTEGTAQNAGSAHKISIITTGRA